MTIYYSIDGIRQLLEPVLATFLARFKASLITLHLYSGKHRRLYLPMGVGLLDADSFYRGVPNMARTPGEIVLSQEPVFAEDAETFPGLAGPFTFREQVKSVAGVPLRSLNSTPLGVAFLNYRTHRLFTTAEKQEILQASEDLSREIEESLVDYWDSAFEAALAESALHTSEVTALYQIVALARTLLDESCVAIWMYDAERQGYVIRASAGVDQLTAAALVVTDEQDLVALAMRIPAGVLVSDLSTDPRFSLKDFASTLRWKSALAIPIVSRYGDALGVYCAYTVAHSGFTQKEENILRSFAALTSGRIESERKIVSLNALHDLSTRVVPLDLTHTINEIVEATPRVTGAEIATIHLYDVAKQEFFDLARSATFGAHRSNMEKPRTEGGSGARIIREGLVVCNDIREQPAGIAASTFVKNEGVGAYVGVRLWGSNRPLGVLYVSYRERHRFTEDEVALIRTLGYYASTAIASAALLEQRQALQDIALEIATSLDRDQLLQTVTERCSALLGCEIAALGLLDNQNQFIVFKYSVGEPTGTRVPVGQGLTSVALETRRPVRVDDTLSDLRYLQFSVTTRSELDIPVLVGNRLVGVLNAESKRVGAFGEEHESLGVTLAAQIALALYNIELFETTQSKLEQRVRDITTLQDVNAAAGAVSLDEILKMIAQRASEITGSHYVGVYLLDRQSRELYFGALAGAEVTDEMQNRRFPLAGKGINAHVARTGDAYLCQDTLEDSTYYPSFPDVRSELTVPLKYGGRLFGTLDLESKQAYAFTNDHVSLMKAFAGVAATATWNFWRFQDLHTLAEIGQALTRGARLRRNEVLELIHSQLAKLMNVDNMFIALYDAFSNEVSFQLAIQNGDRVPVKSTPGLERRTLGAGRTDWIIRTRQFIFHPTRREAESWYAEADHKEYTGFISASWMGVPMTVGEKVLGVIAVHHPDIDDVYNRDDLAVLISVANQAAIALDNENLYYDVNQRWQSLVEISHRLSSGLLLKEHEILESIFRQASLLTGAQDLYIALYDELADEVSFPMAMVGGKQVDTETESGWQPRSGGSGRTEWIVRNRERLFHNTQADGTAWYGLTGHKEYIGQVLASFIGVPMKVGDKVLGVLAVFHPQLEHAFSDGDAEVISAMATQAAIAIENTRLYQQASRESIARRQLATIGQAIAPLQHRINNTLLLVIPNLNRLKRWIDLDNPKVLQIFGIIERNIGFTSQVFRRIQEPLREFDRQELDINALLYETISAATDQWQADMIDINADLEESLPLISASSGQVSEVFRNLIENACREMIQLGRGSLTVISRFTNNQIEVRVQDTGPGISSIIAKQLITKPVASKEAGGSTGLGLWLSGLMINSLGGSLAIEQTSPTGTTMLVRIPVPTLGDS